MEICTRRESARRKSSEEQITATPLSDDVTRFQELPIVSRLPLVAGFCLSLLFVVRDHFARMYGAMAPAPNDLLLLVTTFSNFARGFSTVGSRA